MTLQFLLLTTSDSDISVCSTLVEQNDLLSDPLCTTISKFAINSSTLSPLIDVSDHHTRSIVSPLDTNYSNMSSPNNSVLDNNRSSIVTELESSCITLSPAISFRSKTFTSPELTTVGDSDLNVTFNRHESTQDSYKSALNSEMYLWGWSDVSQRIFY